MERIINTTTETTTETTTISISISVIEEMSSYIGATWADIAAQMVEAITSASSDAEVVVFAGENYEAEKIRRNFGHLARFCNGNGQFDFRRYYTAGKVWAFSPELHEIFDNFNGFPDSFWSSMETGRIGALKYDAQKGQILAIAPGAIAKNRIESYQRALDLSPVSLVSHQIEALLKHGPHIHWRLDYISPSILEELPGNPIKPGKIIRHFWPDLTNSEVERLADEFSDHLRRSNAAVDVEVTQNIISVYNSAQGDFESCMRGKGEYYRDLLQWVERSLCIAVIKEEKTVVSRALLWPEVHLQDGRKIKLMDRIYYSSPLHLAAMQQWAREHNYHYKKTQSIRSNVAIAPNGSNVDLSYSYILLSKKLNAGCWDNAPYLDSFRCCNIGERCLYIWSLGGQIELDRTNGSGGLLTETPDCEWCNNPALKEINGIWLCNDCYSNSVACDICDQLFDARQTVDTDDAGSICPECWANEGWTCESCGYNYTSATTGTEVEFRDSTETSGLYCPDCLNDVDSTAVCKIANCNCIIPDSPSGYCNYHESQLFYSCNNCGILSPRKREIIIDLPHKHLHLCGECNNKLSKYNYLDPIGIYQCSSCNKIRANRPDELATIAGVSIYCPDCLHEMQAPDDWIGEIPARIIRPRTAPDSGLKPQNYSKSRLLEICRFWRAEENPHRLKRRIAEFIESRNNGTLPDYLQLHAAACAAHRKFPDLCPRLQYNEHLGSWELWFIAESIYFILWYRLRRSSVTDKYYLFSGFTG